MMRTIHLLIVLVLMSRLLAAQQVGTVTIEACYRLAVKNSPLYQQKTLTTASGRMTEKNLNLQWLPRLDINAQASYQSEVTSLPVKIPNVNIEELDKDQYKATLDLLQPVYDGGVVARQKKLQRLTTETESQKVEVDLYQLRSTINGYYFTVLLMDQNMQLMKLVKQDLYNSIKTIAARVLNGIATKSDEDLLNAAVMNTDQQLIESGFHKKQALEGLSIITGADINEQTTLVTPVASYNSADTLIRRPEIKLFELQLQDLQWQSKLINAKTNPRLSFFANGGYGKPGLNQLKNEFDWFYITGVKLNIPVMGHVTQKNDKAVLKIREQITGKQKENFLVNNRQQVVRQKSEIEKYSQLVAFDSAIIVIRGRIKENAFVKLSNGIITTNDYITELTAESQARLNQQLHQVMLLQAQYSYKAILGE